jgi:hypothetical protein
MGFFRNKSKISCPLSSREEQLLSRISELEEFIEGAPERIRQEMEEEITTMPPPDDLEDRRREHKFYSRLSRGEIRNEHRCQTKSAFLFLLLVTAILTLSFWIYSVLQAV